MLVIYNILIWFAFLFFIPSLLYKLKKRAGYKESYMERFGFFNKARLEEFEQYQKAIWIHAVSVGESVVALSLISDFHAAYPETKIILSTTTTTGQALAREKADKNTLVIYCPIDFKYAVKRVFNLFNPKMLLILETELWPNMIYEAKKRGVKLGLINGRMSDKSCRGYYKFRLFFGKLLSQFDFISAQSDMDGERFRKLSYADNVIVSGNIKFDQKVPENLEDAKLNQFFGKNFDTVILGASTHEGEEELIINSFVELREKNSKIKLILIPRHAERGREVAEILSNKGVSFLQKSLGKNSEEVDCLLADTTGEMLKFINVSDIVIMGKSLASHDEGHNLIEPALLHKAIVCGKKVSNFRYLFDLLKSSEALAVVNSDLELTSVLAHLIEFKYYRQTLGENAFNAVSQNAGASKKNIKLIVQNL